MRPEIMMMNNFLSYLVICLCIKPVSRDSVEALYGYSFRLNELDTATQKHGDRVLVTSSGGKRMNNLPTNKFFSSHLKSSIEGWP